MKESVRDILIRRVKNGEKLMDEDFSGVNLSRAILPDVDLYGIKLSKAVMSEAVLTKAMLANADLAGAVLSWSKLMEANFYEAYLHGAALVGADLSGADARGADFSGANLHRANLTNVNLQRADLRNSRFSRADLNGANLTGAKLYGIILAGAKLDNVICEWYDYSRDGNGSDVRHSFDDLLFTLKTQVTVTSNTELDFRLLGGLAGLAKLIKALNVTVSKVEDYSGSSMVTFEAAGEEDLIPAVIILFNALLNCKKIDFEALASDMPYLEKMAIDDKSLIDVLKELLGPVDSSRLHYSLLENFRLDFADMTVNVQGELVGINRRGEELNIKYPKSIDRRQLEEPVQEVVKPFTSVAIAKIIKWLLAH